MCFGCFIEQWEPERLKEVATNDPVEVASTEVTAEVVKLAALVKLHYAVPGNGVGGRYHIHLDDWNVDRLMDPAETWGTYLDPTPAERELAVVWNALDEKHRALGIALADDYDKTVASPWGTERSPLLALVD